MSPSPPAGCGGSISSWNGSITSPYYPSYYPPNIDCTWTVRVSHMTVCAPVCEWKNESVSESSLLFFPLHILSMLTLFSVFVRHPYRDTWSPWRSWWWTFRIPRRQTAVRKTGWRSEGSSELWSWTVSQPRHPEESLRISISFTSGNFLKMLKTFHVLCSCVFSALLRV